MKLLKKASAVLLALAMIAVMIPQLGSKVVKAAEPSSTDVWEAAKQSTSAATTTSPNGLIKATGKVSKNQAGSYTQALKTGSSSFFTITAPQGKFVKVTVVANVNKKDDSMSAIEVEGNSATRKFIRAQSSMEPEEVTLTGYLEGGVDANKDYKLVHVQNQLFIYKVTVVVYDNINDIPVDPTIHKVKVTGTIQSDLSLDKGKINFGLYEGTLSRKEGTTNEYTYELADVESDGSVYPVSITSDEVTKSLKNIDPTSYDAKNGKKVIVNYTEGSDTTEMNFTLKYTSLDGLTWNFADTAKNWQAITYEAGRTETGIYKGLEITATTVSGAKGKFDVQPANGRVQINTATKVKIPVSGCGTVTCAFSGTANANTTLGIGTDVTTGSNKKDASLIFNYKNAEYVELNIGTDNSGLYLKSITVTPDPVSQLGASVRQETEAWGNGIRFGGQLNLKKVDTTCESGTLIGLKSVVGENEMTLDNAGVTCVKVERTTYIEETESSLVYAAALIKIPNDQLNTEIVARPYVKDVKGTVYYGEQITTSHSAATAALAANK